jgi:molybdopterin synthase catalytic subunit
VAELTRQPIDVAGLQQAGRRPDCGALALFLGTTRDHHAGRRVVRLAYQAYERMALPALEEIEREAVRRFGVASCRIVHRLGDVPVAEPSVAVLVAAAHRGPAFDACRWAMDELKRSAPIWKQEQFEEGGAEWVEGTTLRSPPNPPSPPRPQR